MSNWSKYRRVEVPAEMRPYVPGEDLTGVSIGDEDRKNGSPASGDMIARDPENLADQWLVNAAYFQAKFYPEPIGPAMHAFRITECDFYAAHTFEEAFALAEDDMGAPRGEMYRGESNDRPLPRDLRMPTESRDETTVGAELDKMTEPGWFAGQE